MDSLIANIVLVGLVLVLAALLVIRQRQLKKFRPLANFDQVISSLVASLETSRADGKIQKVANELSNIFVKYFQSDRILFFRKQRRFMEMNYVYGIKNLQRARYRIYLTDELSAAIIDGQHARQPAEIASFLSDDLRELLDRDEFNLLFPIAWGKSLFGIYFIRTRMELENPLINAFLAFLNQNLSVTYQLRRLESNRKILENKLAADTDSDSDKETAATTKGDDDPGPLIEIFSHHKFDDFKSSLCDKLKSGLKAQRLILVTIPNRQSKESFNLCHGTDVANVAIDTDEFRALFGKLNKREIYDIRNIPEVEKTDSLKEILLRNEISHLTTFSLGDNEPGLLFWSGSRDMPIEGKLLSRMEKVAQRAIQNVRAFEKIEAMSYTDPLTGLYNHRYFIKRLNEEIQRAIRYQRRVGLLLFDIDDFKIYNDSFGHQWGDVLLRRMGGTLAKCLRSIDIVSRYGGDEFCIIMPEADQSTCGMFMDRLRHTISSTDFRDKANGFEGRITISIGCSIFPDNTRDAEKLIYFADMALLKAKALGRNCSVIFDEALLEQKARN